MGKNVKDMRHDSFIENMRELMMVHPEYTWEKAYNDAMTLWTLHDYSAFKSWSGLASANSLGRSPRIRTGPSMILLRS